MPKFSLNYRRVNLNFFEFNLKKKKKPKTVVNLIPSSKIATQLNYSEAGHKLLG